MKRVLSIAFVVALVFVGTLSASGAKEATGTPKAGGKISFILTYSKQKTAFYKAIDDFQKESGIQVEVQYLPLFDAEKQIKIQVLSQSLSDVLDIDGINTASFASQGILGDLTPYVKKDIDPSKYFDVALSFQKYNGKYYSMPFTTDNIGMFYNKDMFAAAGITSFPKTWDELRDALSKLSKNGVYGIAMAGNKTNNSTFTSLCFMFAAGYSIPTLGDKATVDTLSFYKEMLDKGWISHEMLNWSLQDAADQFIAQKAAILVNGSWEIAQLKNDAKFAWDAAPMPAGAAGPGTTYAGHNLAAANNKNLDNSWKLIMYLNRPEVEVAYSVPENYIPARKDGLALTDYYKTNPIKVFVDMMNVSHPRGPLVQWPQYDNVMLLMLQSVTAGMKTPEQAAKDAAADSAQYLK